MAYLENILWLFNPSSFFGLISEINTYGTWGIGSSEYIINGFLLTVVWLSEIIIISLPMVLLIMDFDVLPFSEKLNKWYKKYTIDDDFESMYSGKLVDEKLDKGVLTALTDLLPGNGARHSKIHLYYLEGENSQYLSIDKVVIDPRSGKIAQTPVVENYRISDIDAKAIQNEFNLTRQGLISFKGILPL